MAWGRVRRRIVRGCSDMRGAMAINTQDYNADAARSVIRDRSPDSPVGRSGCCTGLLRFGSRKRGKRIVPASRAHDGNTSSSRPWGGNGPPQSNSSHQYATLSPSLLAPPSSPSSFQNSAVQSSAQSPSTYPIAHSVPCATSQSPLESTPTMFQMGPYAHETALVSPPVFSTFTTAPSTAPFTPPPELATHVTTPSSPDVPFAQLLASSFGAKGQSRVKPMPTHSASPFASPDIFPSDDLQAAYQLFPGSPLAHLLSPASGTGESTPVPDLEFSSQCTPFPEFENSAQAVAAMFFPGSALMSPASATVHAESLLSQALSSSTFLDLQPKDQLLSNTISAFLEDGDDRSESNLLVCDMGERSMNGGADGCQQQSLTIFGSCRDYLRIEENSIESKGDGHKIERDTGPSGCLSGHASSVESQFDNRYSSDASDRGLGHITVICNIGFGEGTRKCPNVTSPSGSIINREAHSRTYKSSLSTPFNVESRGWRKFPIDNSLTKLAIPGIPIIENCRTENAIQLRSTSKDLPAWSGRTSKDSSAWGGPTAVFDLSDNSEFLRLQLPAGVVPSKVYFDPKSSNQLDSTGSHCTEQSKKDSCQKCDNLHMASNESSEMQGLSSN